MEKFPKSWFAIDGSLEDIGFQGDSHFRFPKELAKLVLEKFSNQNDWIIDPFAGFGTTIHTAQDLGRNAIGFEVNIDRATFANQGLHTPNKVIHAGIETLGEHDLPMFDLLFTSPPYISVRLEDDPWGKTYFQDMKHIFDLLRKKLKPSANIVVEISNVKTESGFRALAGQFGELLSQIFELQDEIVRCNTSDTLAGPGVNHSYLLIFKQKS